MCLFLITLFTQALWESKGNDQHGGALKATASTIQRGAFEAPASCLPLSERYLILSSVMNDSTAVQWCLSLRVSPLVEDQLKSDLGADPFSGLAIK